MSKACCISSDASDEISLSDDECNETYFVEQYVSDVTDFSSQYGSDISISYTANNITGKPSKFPDYGDFPQAFVMRTYGKWWNEAPSKIEEFMPQNHGDIIGDDFIEVFYEQSVYPCCVSLYETYNPGALVRIWAQQPESSWALLWEGPPQYVGHTPRIFTPSIQSTEYPTNVLRLEFNQRHLDYYTELDAVLLVGTKTSQMIKRSPKSYKQSSKIGNGLLTSKVKELCLHESVVGRSEAPDELLTLSSFLEQLMEDWYKESAIYERNLGNMSCLPDETILKIFRYLDLRSLSRCACVSLHMNRLATDPMLYKSLSLKPYWHCFDRTALNAFTGRCDHLQKLDASWCGSGKFLAEDFSRFLRFSGKGITHLRLNCCKFVTNNLLIDISKICLSLKELAIRNCLVVRESGFNALSALNTLERLDFYRTAIENPPLQLILQANPKIKHLNLGSCGHLSSMDDIAIQLTQTNTHLISLDLWKCYSLTPIGLRALGRLSNLQELDISWCMGVGAPGDTLHTIAQGCPDLRKIFLVALRGVSDRDLLPLATMCHHLEQVDLLGVRNITGDICIKFLTNCHNLKMLDVSFCDQLLDSQVALWRQAFPSVSIKRSFQSRAGVADMIQPGSL